MSQFGGIGTESARHATSHEKATAITMVRPYLEKAVLFLLLTDVPGLIRDHSQDFFSIRRKTVDARFLEISRLEKRLTKLTQLLSSQIAEQGTGNSGILWPLSGQRNQRKALEQSVVTWEDDASVSICPFCQQEFSTYVNRRHHCRLCGRVVCGDPRTGCSTEVGLDVAHRELREAISAILRSIANFLKRWTQFLRNPPRAFTSKYACAKTATIPCSVGASTPRNWPRNHQTFGRTKRSYNLKGAYVPCSHDSNRYL